MLKKLNPEKEGPALFQPGSPVYIVTKKGVVLEGFQIQSRLFNLVSLNRSPIEGSEKQGFTIDGERLRPNWCEGRKKLVAAYPSREAAEKISKKYIPRSDQF